MLHEFPSLEWMQAYAEVLAGHDRAADMAASLEGRYRFTITPGGGLDVSEAYDLTVAVGPSFVAEPAGTQRPVLAITADYSRWKGLLTGKSDFVMSYLMRRIKVDGDLGAIRSRLSDAKPLLDSLTAVPTDFRY